MSAFATTIQQVFPEFEPALAQQMENEAMFRQIPANTDLMRPGQFIRSTMLVLSGLIKVYREDDDGNEFFMYHLQPGDGCALSMTCMVGQERSTIAAKTVQDSEVIMIPLDKMDAWMSQYKSWYHFVVKTYRNRFEELLQTLDNVAFRNMDERLEFYLKRQQKTLDSRIIPVTHQEIAQDLNSSREVISRLLKKLAERGKVRLHRYHIEIMDL
ncbi:MAG: Crp/Fnr family transcriptional regulator [Chitinophagaceae bacterium]|jgi:CRP/FNR family transcriptional regulator|nr:Crp/Fnr family transcriptional regulator [Chitinophagaceae bacterium]